MKLVNEIIMIPNIDKIDDILQDYDGKEFSKKSILLTYEELNRLQSILTNQIKHMCYADEVGWPYSDRCQMTYKGFPIITAEITDSKYCDVCAERKSNSSYRINLCKHHYKVMQALSKMDR